MILPALLRPSYWFDLNPPPLLPVVDRVVLSVFTIFFVAGIVGHVLAWKLAWDTSKKRAVRLVASRAVTLGLCGLLLYFFSYERVSVLSLRAGFLAWFGLAVWYGWKSYQLFFIDIPALEERQRLQREKSRWLPKKH